MRMTTRSRYGTRMMLDIAYHGQDGPVRVNEIARRQNLSVKYLEKLVRELKAAGLVNSKRGPKGGHSLSRPPSEITVGDIVRVLEGGTTLVDCGVDEERCERAEHCPTRDVWVRAANAMYNTLAEVTLDDLLRDYDIADLGPCADK
ncbi:MAG: RrF2 family transcriptional regulator [Desulfovibrio sp.]|uniref:RrF2 family transcriptional regulator n=1 Tax=Desulfovibrio sp. 7SRBS1 TaxID=3378064 RepID=UPI003B3C3B18